MTGIKVLAFGAWDRGPGYPRGTSLLEGLRRRGISVAECRFDLPYSGAAKRALVAAPWKWPGFVWSMRRARKRAMARLRESIASECPDVILVPYPGHVVVRWARRVFEGPVILDLFLSVYDTAVLDRRMFREGSLVARWLRRVDRRACSAADRVLLDTKQNAAFVATLVDQSEDKFEVVPVSDAQAPEQPPAYRPPAEGARTEILFFGTGVPLHGLSVLLDAVSVCDNLRLTLIGGSDEDRARARSLPNDRLRLLERFVGTDELYREIAATHLVAGVFGTTDKTDRVVPFKVMHALAMGRPVITANTTAVAAVLNDGVDAILVAPGNATALEVALSDHRTSAGELASIANNARATFERQFSLDCVGEALEAVIAECMSSAIQSRSTPVGMAKMLS